MVGLAKIWRGVNVIPARRARASTWIDRIESPPRSKKLSCVPMSGTRSTSLHTSARVCSMAVLRRHERLSLRCRQGGACRLVTIGFHRQPVQHHEHGRHRVVGQPRTGGAHAARRSWVPCPPWEPRRPPAARRRQDNRVGQPGMRREHRLDLAQFDPENREPSPVRPAARGTPASRPAATAPGPRCDKHRLPGAPTDRARTAARSIRADRAGHCPTPATRASPGTPIGTGRPAASTT